MPIDSEAREVQSIEAKKRNSLRARLMAAYQSWLNQEPGSEENLFEIVRELAYVKTRHVTYEFEREFAETPDDWAQNVCLQVWETLENGTLKNKNPEGFYAYVHKVSYTEAAKAFKHLLEEQQTFVPLMVPVVDEHGIATGEEEDNPEIYNDPMRDKYVYIPASITGVDLRICYSFLTGVPYEDKSTDPPEWKERTKTYAEVANELNMTEASVKQRLRRLRDRLIKERQDEKAANFRKWIDAINWKVPPR